MTIRKKRSIPDNITLAGRLAVIVQLLLPKQLSGSKQRVKRDTRNMLRERLGPIEGSVLCARGVSCLVDSLAKFESEENQELGTGGPAEPADLPREPNSP